MKSIGCALAILATACAAIYAQTDLSGPAGTWQLDQPRTTLVLKVDGPSLSGTFIGGLDISEARIDGDTIAFKVQFPDGGRTVTFTGKLNGDELKFTRTLVVPKDAVAGGAGVLGIKGPSDFTLYRVIDGSEWSGTVRTAPTPRNPNPNPNPREAGLFAKRVPTPHWRWSGTKSLETRMFRLANGVFEVNGFELDGDRLSFSFTQGTNVRTCKLARQTGRKFEGTCQEGSLLIDLTPTSTTSQSPPSPAARN